MLYNILLVEDDHTTAQSLADLIGVLGHTVVIAYGPRAALHNLSEVIPDVIFMDLNLPGVNGLEVLRFLRRDPTTAKVPVVILTAEDQSRAEAMEAGANDYLLKPPTLDDIEAAINRVVCPPKTTNGNSPAIPPPTPNP